MLTRCDVAVAGGGMGGLMAGALLAHAGRRVIVAEAAQRPGGYQTRFEVDGAAIEPHFHFLQDAGRGRPVARLLDRLGIDLDRVRVDPLVEYHFPDRRVTMPTDRATFIAQLKDAFPHEAAGIDELFATTAAIYAGAQRLPVLAPAVVRHGADTVADVVGRCVGDRRLRTIAGGWAAYFGYGLKEISGLAIAIFTESCFDGGVRQPVGGITALADALCAVIERHGGEVRCSARVRRIRLVAGRVGGLELDGGDPIESAAVISNVNLLDTLRDLVGDHGAAPLVRRLERLARFRSPFSVFTTVDADAVDLSGGSPVRVVFPSYDTTGQDRARLAGDVESAPVSLPEGIAPDQYWVAEVEGRPSMRMVIDLKSSLDPGADRFYSIGSMTTEPGYHGIIAPCLQAIPLMAAHAPGVMRSIPPALRWNQDLRNLATAQVT